MRKRLISVLAFAMAVSAGAAFVLYQLISSKVNVGAASPRPQTTKVWVASRDLEVGALINEHDVVERDYLAPPAGVLLKKEEIIGRGVANPIHGDTPFYEGYLAPKGAGAGFASIIPKGMRAFAVHVNEVVGVAGFAVAGMRVDILVSGSPPSAAASTSGAVTRTLLQNIEVLSAGQNYRKDAEGKPVLVQVVNVLVTPQQAEILNLATEERIQLVLRNPTDQEIVSTPGAATAGLFNGGAKPAPATDAAVRVFRPKVESPQPMVESRPIPLPQTVMIEVFHGAQRTEASVRAEQEQSQ